MYRDGYFYGLSDILHFNVMASFLKDRIIKEERAIIKVFKRGDEIVVIETLNSKDEILKDTRKDKNEDITNFDLVFLKSLERYYSDYELPGMVYEYVEGIGSWYRVKVPDYDPLDKRLKPFYLKKKITKKDLEKYSDNKIDLEYLERFMDIKGDIKFNKPKDVKEFFIKIELL